MNTTLRISGQKNRTGNDGIPYWVRLLTLSIWLMDCENPSCGLCLIYDYILGAQFIISFIKYVKFSANRFQEVPNTSVPVSCTSYQSLQFQLDHKAQ